MVSKRPSPDAVREASLSVGDRNRYQGSFDLGGALNDDASLLWRLNGVLRNSAGQTDFSRDDRTFIAPSLMWKPSPRTTVTLLAEATRDRLTPKSMWPESALLTPDLNRRIPRERYVGEPGFDRYNRDAFSLTYLLEHRLSEHWTLRQTARHAALDIDYRQVSGTGFQSDMRTLNRMAARSKNNTRDSTLDTQLEGRFRTGPVSHTLLMGLAYQRQVSNVQGNSDLASPLDAFAPAYGAPVPESRFAAFRSTETLAQVGVHAQDQMRAGPWSLDVAVRQDRARGRYGPAFPVSLGTDTHTTYNAGLVYLAPNGLAPYMSYSTSFTPLTGTIASGEALKPELGRQFEVGLKYRPPGVDALFTVSMFDLRKNNAVTFNPDLFAPYSQIGQVRTRGPEFEVRAALTRQLKLVGSFTLLDARVTRSLAPAELGKQPLNTARQTAACGSTTASPLRRCRGGASAAACAMWARCRQPWTTVAMRMQRMRQRIGNQAQRTAAFLTRRRPAQADAHCVGRRAIRGKGRAGHHAHVLRAQVGSEFDRAPADERQPQVKALVLRDDAVAPGAGMASACRMPRLGANCLQHGVGRAVFHPQGGQRVGDGRRHHRGCAHRAGEPLRLPRAGRAHIGAAQARTQAFSKSQ
jgi:outer membrane receptor protein involved in Fe transport